MLISLLGWPMKSVTLLFFANVFSVVTTAYQAGLGPTRCRHSHPCQSGTVRGRSRGREGVHAWWCLCSRSRHLGRAADLPSSLQPSTSNCIGKHHVNVTKWKEDHTCCNHAEQQTNQCFRYHTSKYYLYIHIIKQVWGKQTSILSYSPLTLPRIGHIPI